MKCQECLKDLPEHLIQESHDVPCYLFFLEGFNRKQRKPYADKYPRRWLCKHCHDEYERDLRDHLVTSALKFSKYWRKKEDDTKNSDSA